MKEGIWLLRFVCLFCLVNSVGAQSDSTAPPSKLSIHGSYGIFAPVIGARANDWPGGFGSSLRLRVLSNQVISAQIGTFYNQFLYIAPQAYATDNSFEISDLPDAIFDPYLKSNGHPDGIWYPSFKSTMVGIDLTANVSLRNALKKFAQKNTSWDVSLNLGIGYMHKSIDLDLLDASQQPYSNLRSITGADSGVSFDTSDGRKSIRSSISKTYDNRYETESAIGNLNYLMGTYGLTISKMFAKKYEVGINYKAIVFNNNSIIEKYDDQTFNYLATTDEKHVLISVGLGYHW
jgi:hypothetical protein